MTPSSFQSERRGRKMASLKWATSLLELEPPSLSASFILPSFSFLPSFLHTLSTYPSYSRQIFAPPRIDGRGFGKQPELSFAAGGFFFNFLKKKKISRRNFAFTRCGTRCGALRRSSKINSIIDEYSNLLYHMHHRHHHHQPSLAHFPQSFLLCY